MATFSFTRERIDEAALRTQLLDPTAGGYASFEGWVRNHNEGHAVRHLEYEAFELLAIKEGERIVAEAIKRFRVEHAACVHRIGDLAIGDMAVWVGVSARHRAEAFAACRYIIDEVKHRVPIWKKEHYVNGDSGWVNCERCAAPGAQHESGHHETHTQRLTAPAAATLASNHAGVGAPIPDYSRQMALKEVGAAGQAKLRASRVLVIGCGGLGVPVISYLAGAGIGRLGLVDSDRLEPSNLQRQTMYALADVGKLKSELAADRVRALNPDVDVRTHTLRIDATNASDLIAHYDLVIDCTDNFSTKFILNDYCVQLNKPVVFASVYQYEGQLQIVRPGSACLRCLWPEATRDGIVGNCSEAGVLGPVPGVFGGLQAFEALKLLLDLPGQLNGELLVLDLLTLSASRVKTRRATSCPDHAISRVTATARSGKTGALGAAAPGATSLGSTSLGSTSLGSTSLGSTSPGATSPGATSSDPASLGAPITPVEIGFDTLAHAYDAGFDIVDIREPHELEQIPTSFSRSRNVPIAQLLYGQPAFAPLRKTLLVCATGRRSLAAAQELRERGLREIYSLRGGVKGLQQARLLT